MKSKSAKRLKKQKPAYVTRLMAMIIDFFVYATIDGIILRALYGSGIKALADFSTSPIGMFLVAFFSVAAYFLVLELRFGRTFGKMVMGMHCRHAVLGQSIGKLQWITRTAARFLFFVPLFSWKRVTLLDLVTRIRVYNTSAPVTEQDLVTAKTDLPQPLGWR